MPRMVRFDAIGPVKIEPANFPRDEQGNLKAIFVCACGLSSRLPFCDGTHKVCKDEEAGHVYSYDAATKRVIDKTPASGGPTEVKPD